MAESVSGHGPHWRISGGRRLTPAPFLVAGIVNLTPDSFSDGGSFAKPDDAVRRIRRMAEAGAHIIDIGAESTRPGATDIGHGEEWRRLRPVLEKTLELREKDPPESFALSVDTFRPKTAAAALSLRPGGGRVQEQGRLCSGVDIINDISGASFDPLMPDVLGSFKPGYVLGHSPALPAVMQAAPRYTDVVDELLRWFGTRMDILVKAGLPEECICLDPCIGFGKTFEHNLEIIAAIPRFAALGRPLFFGISRKSLIGEITGLPVRDRDTSTQVLTAVLAKAGVAVHRVHQVEETLRTLQIVRALQPVNLRIPY